MKHDLVFEKRSNLRARPEEVLDWHLRPGAFQRLTPPWEPVRLACAPKRLEDGDRVELETRLGPLRTRWIAEHSLHAGAEPGFEDRQVEGPFSLWRHEHRMLPAEPATGPGGGCTMVDRIEYRLPFGPLGRLLGGRYVRGRLERMFAFRHRVLANDLNDHDRRTCRPMKILVSGASGLVGTELCAFLSTGGHEVARLVRSKPQQHDVSWSPDAGTIAADALEGLDGVVHLAGENIGVGRWSERKKRAIVDSRVQGTRLLAEALAARTVKPGVFVGASAIGYYGDRGDTSVDESAPRGEGFLADVCARWEAATEPLREAGVRVVNLRFGVILSPAGGALGTMLLPFRLGAGGKIGDGRQFMSWITLEDVVRVVSTALTEKSLVGPVNAVAPNPVTNAEFTKTLGRVLSRPTILPLPAFGARLAFGGEKADEMLLASTRVQPKALIDAGFAFRHPDLETGLRDVLGKTR